MTISQFEDRDIERQAEQLYFDAAREHRERRRDLLGHLPDAAIHKGAAAGLSRIGDDVAKSLQGPDEAVAFGRIDFAEPEDEEYETFYVGKDVIHNEDTKDVLVVDWRSQVAAPYYAATVGDPCGLLRKRSYFCEKNAIVDFDDVLFAELAARVAELGTELAPDDALLAELARSRTGEMQEIARTIQAAQYEIVRAPFDQLLVVQGGPGTGKTAVALHRVSWLLFNQDGLSPQSVLVVGPNPTFIRYIKTVLPELGDRDVPHLDVARLGAVEVQMGREEPADVARLKGDQRMAGLLDRALQQRVRIPDDGLSIAAGGRTARLSAAELAGLVDGLRLLPYSAGRAALRERLRSLAAGARPDAVDNALDRVWPNLTAAQFVQELLGSQNRLLEAAGEEFSAREVQTLHRQAASKITDEVWSSADVALLDHAHALISDKAGDRYAHIVVDEAQDLSPMQLAMIARRSSNGSMTILGDIAQSTGLWARDDWSDVIEALSRSEVDVTVEELEIGYRVPRLAFELAVEVLSDAAPGANTPRIVREGPAPDIREVEAHGVASASVTAAQELVAAGNRVGVVCPDAARSSVLAAFKSANVRIAEARTDGLNGAITLVSPIETKGLEFDAVVVVEPMAIAASDAQRRRQLYIAFTRTTGALAVVHSIAFLTEFAGEAAGYSGSSKAAARSGSQSARHDPELTVQPALDHVGVTGPADAVTRAIAKHFVDEIRKVVREDQVEAILMAIIDELTEP